MDLVIKRLYLGRRPSQKDLRTNGSILSRLHKKGHSWETLAKVVEGLASRRDRGELKSVASNEPVSLRWVNDKDQLLNQVAVCQDAAYKDTVVKKGPRKDGVSSIEDVLAQILKGAA